MKVRPDSYNGLVRLNKGEELIASLNQIVQEQNLPSCWVSGLGGAASATIGFYDLETKQYQWQEITEPMEITNLTGNLAWQEGEPIWHIHGTFSKKDMTAIGGHIKQLVVSGTCEILLHKWYADKLIRAEDTDTGLKLLDV